MSHPSPTRPRLVSWPAVIVLASIALSAGTAAFVGRSFISAPIRGGQLAFVNPSSVVPGPGGLIVLADSGDRRLVGLGGDGRLRFVVRGQMRERGFYNGRVLGFDSGGRFYVDDSVLDLATGNARSEAILAFDAEGRRLGPAIERVFDEEESADVTKRFIYSQASPDFLSWFFPEEDGVWAFHSKPTDGGPERPPRRFDDYDVYSSVGAAAVSPDEVYFLESSGRILRRMGEGELETWFSNSEGILRFPVAIAAGPGGRIFVLDGKRSVLRLDPGPGEPEPTTVFDRATASGAGYDKPVALVDVAFGPDGAMYASNEATGEVLALSPSGKLRAYGGAALAGPYAAARALVFALLAFASVTGLAAIVLFYVMIFAMRARLLLKQLSILIPLTAAAAAAIAWSVYGGMSGKLEGEVRDRLLHLSQLASAGLSVEAVDRIDPARGRLEDIVGSEDFLALGKVLDELVNRNEDRWNAKIFPYVYFQRDAEWFILGGFDYLELYPYAYSKPEFSRVLKGGEDVYYRYSDVYGTWLSSLRPLRRADGSVAAVVEASMSGDTFDEIGRATLRNIGFGTAGLLALLVAAFAVFDWLLLRSVKALKLGAERVSAGDYDVEVDIRSKDEIEDLGRAFNSMSREIKGYVERLDRFGRANARFVPTEFISQLGRESILEIGLGDQVLTEMTVLFSDIRSFTSLSESMGPSATMVMLNDYLSRMGPAVRAAGGFIDKYVGDAIMALFPRSPGDAVEAAAAMMAALDDYNAELRERGEPDIDCGFGLHSGKLVLGIIGEKERFEGTVIADAVNLAARLESLTKYYGVRTLVSGTVKDALRGSRRPIRFLDLVRVKGKSESVRIYELIGQGDPKYEAKCSSAGGYVRGFEAYRAGRFDEAADLFEAALGLVPGDRPAEILLERCTRFSASGPPPLWRGVIEFHDK